MGLDIPSSSDWAIKCRNDGEFCLAARYWNGGINLEIGHQRISIQVNEGFVCCTSGFHKHTPNPKAIKNSSQKYPFNVHHSHQSEHKVYFFGKSTA